MEDARTSTSSQRLASTFDTLIESPEADITSIAVVGPEPLSTGNNRDIPVSLQELVYGSKLARVGTSPKSLDRHHELISSIQQINSWSKNQSMLSEDQKKKLAKGKENSPSLHKQNSTSTSAKKAQANPRDQLEGQSKGKGKDKAQFEQALPAKLQDS
ncbi:hypothetical protein O181_008564 [Austropuccinia psidii MF-1]|uniref:Uncharacterized protein n=1 Tax=Austropuccinia psidii MF-1 TaxID=1389203 RepID=A0A9Q3GIZ5_9BASI|nr:hypothetical protein [Austropuccinia psidii MF-1]